MTATLSPVARALLAWLQERPAAGEGSLKSWGQGRRPSLTLTQVEVRAAELVDAGLVTREVLSDGRSKYRARERSPEPPPVEVVTEPGWIPNTGAAGPFYGVDRSPEPKKKARKAPGFVPPAHGSCDACGTVVIPADKGLCENCAPHACAECTRMAEALLSWERLWGINGTDLAAMEARIQEANEERDEARAEADKAAADLAAARAAGLALRRQDAASYAHAGELQERLTDALRLYESMCAELAELLGESTDIPGTFLVARVRDRLAGKATSPSPPAPSAVYGAQLALDALSTSRGTSRREVATRAGISLHSAGKALAALAGEGLAYESTPGLWRRR